MTTELDQAERRAAARAMLVSPVLDRSDAEAFGLVRRHRGDLARLFGDELGYRLDATRSGFARLAKTPGPAHTPRPLRTRNGRDFDNRRYALCCLVLASIETEGERTTAARLFTQVAERGEALPGLGFRTDVAADRRAFVQAVQAVTAMGVLELAEGDEERFARGEKGGDALYRIDRERAALLLAATPPPSLANYPEGLGLDVYPVTDDGRVRRLRHRVMRSLVEEPVVYIDDLDDDERDYLTRTRARIERVLADCFGLSLEVRAEGWAAVDPTGELTDLTFPDYGSVPVAALRICDEQRARRVRGEDPCWPLDDVDAFVARLGTEYAGYWRESTAGNDTEVRRLRSEAVALLVSLRLVRVDDAGLVALPGAARFAAADTDLPVPRRDRSTEQLTLDPDPGAAR